MENIDFSKENDNFRLDFGDFSDLGVGLNGDSGDFADVEVV